MKALRFGRHAAIAVIAAGALALSACGSDNATGTAPAGSQSAGGTKVTGTLTGIGSSAQGAAMDAWKTNFASANSGATVQYSPDGSGAGRKAILDGSAQFAGSDAYLKDDEYASSKSVCGPDGAINVPVYISPIAVAFNVPGVTDLKLDATTVAKIFRGQITKWNDPAIAALNAGVSLPDLKVTPVNRSDDSGTTQNFTDYLNKAAPDIWTAKPAGTWPVQGGEAAQGTSGVIGAVQGGNGTVGYADESQAGSLGKALIKVGDAYTGPTAEAAANVLAESKRVEGRGDSSFAFDLNRTTTAAGTYPIVLVSYQIACSKYSDAAQANLVKGFLTYTTSAEGQQTAAQAAGSAPLSDALRAQIEPAISGISAGA